MKEKINLLIVVLVIGIFVVKIAFTPDYSKESSHVNNTEVFYIVKYLGNSTECTIEEYKQFNNALSKYYKQVAVHGYVAEIKDEHSITVSDEKGDYAINVFSTNSIEQLTVGQEVFLPGDMCCCTDDDKGRCYGIELDDSSSKKISVSDENVEYIHVDTFYKKCDLLYKKTRFLINSYLIQENIYGGPTYYLVEANNHNDNVNRIRVMFTNDADIDQYVNTKVQTEAYYWDPVDYIALSNAEISQ